MNGSFGKSSCTRFDDIDRHYIQYIVHHDTIVLSFRYFIISKESITATIIYYNIKIDEKKNIYILILYKIMIHDINSSSVRRVIVPSSPRLIKLYGLCVIKISYPIIYIYTFFFFIFNYLSVVDVSTIECRICWSFFFFFYLFIILYIYVDDLLLIYISDPGKNTS